MDITSNAVGTKAPIFVNLGVLDVNSLEEFNTFGAPATRVRRLMNGTHWSTQDHVLEKLHPLEWSGQGQSKTIAIKLIFKMGSKIRTLGARMIQWVDHLWTRIILIQTLPTKKLHQLTRFLSEKKCQTPRHEHNQQSRQHDQQIPQSKMEKCTYQRTWR